MYCPHRHASASSTGAARIPAVGTPPRTGATVLEFALTVPVFFTVLIGMIEVGRGLMLAHQLSNAARIGARYATIPGVSSSEIQTMVNENLGRQGISATVTVKVNGTVTESATAVMGSNITVDAAVPFSQFTWMPGSRYLRGNLTGRHSLRRE